jgi:hypothetical protein
MDPVDEDPTSDVPEADPDKQRFAGMRVVTSNWIPAGMALIMPDEVADEANRRGYGLRDLES